MVSEVTLTPGDYAVLSRVPAEWFEEPIALHDISQATKESLATVRKRLAHLIVMRLVERRTRHTIEPFTEIRRIGK